MPPVGGTHWEGDRAAKFYIASSKLREFSVHRLLITLASIGRLAAPYFRSEDRRAGWLLLASVIAIELSIVAINVMINQWNNEFYNALQDRDWNKFVYQIWVFTILAMAYIGLAVYQLYLNQW